ncbi:ABC transporter substrate-binding protein [Brevundimonas faecalis]|uniref:Peptide/nickel transport system substrate-binding protein n=1 Tax=Brevundimonas faecalis TaxID=947378 RepID=A0ABV2R9V2_9CAUL
MSLRRLIAIACLGAALLSGCDDKGRRADDQVLRIAAGSLPASLGNPFKGNGRPGSLVWLAIYDGLTAINDEGRLGPGLAVEWRALEPNVWRFKLREGVRYSNGRPFDAEAAAEVFAYLATPEGQRTTIGSEARNIAEARPVGPYELELRTKRPDPILPRRLAAVMMIEPRTVARIGMDAYAQKPVGTGAFVMTGWDQRSRRLTLARNPASWRPSSIDGVVFYELPSATSRTQALLSGDVDFSLVDLEETERLERKRFHVVYTPSMQVKAYSFRNVGGDPASPLKDVRVRQALNYAVDKTAIASLLPKGAKPSGQPAPTGVFGHDPSIPPYPYDPAKARRLLAEAGYPKGFDLTMEVLTDAAPGDDMMSQAVAEYWRAVGVNTRLQVMTMPDFLMKYQTNTWAGEALALSWNSFQYYDVTRAMEDFSCTRPTPFFCDQAITERLKKARVIMDDHEREAAYRDLARLYREAAPSVFLIEHQDVFAYSPRVENVKIRHRVPVYEQMKLR